MNLDKIKPHEWIYHGHWPQPIFSSYPWIAWYDPEIVREFRVPLSSAETIIANGHFIVNKSVVAELQQHLSQIMAETDYTFLEHFETTSIKILEESVVAITQLDSADSESFIDFLRILRKAMSPWYLAALFSLTFEPYLEKEVKNGVTYADLMASLPRKETLITKQYRDALKIRKAIEKKGMLHKLTTKSGIATLQKDTKLWAKVQKHVEAYAWVGISNFLGEPLTTEKFMRDLTALTTKQKNPSKKYRMTKDQLFTSRLGSSLGFVRQYSAEMNSLLEYKSLPFLKQVAKKIGLTYAQMMNLAPTEIEALLRGKQSSAVALVKKRKQGYVIWQEKGQIVTNNNPETIAAFLGNFVPEADKSHSVLRGVSASRGYAKGIAKIIMDPSDFHKLRPNDVLVTAMTTPDFVLLMQQASAIVTDGGGFLSHAAIVSRELGKPCVMGTKFATRVLKDGEMLEVDADQGIVRKLEED